jgi:hypothetical protein
MGDPTTGVLCELNDPEGRFGDAHSPDPRFQVDWNNPTVTTANGYPVGIPIVQPAVNLNGFPLPPTPARRGDPDRPTYNRPRNGTVGFPTDPFLPLNAPLKNFTMPFAAAPNANTVVTPDPWKQVPLFAGDWVDFSGTLFKLNISGPNTAANSFISVHSLTAHLGIKTTPGTDPAYVRVEEFLFGVGQAGNAGPTVAGIAQETSTRVVLVAFCTDNQGNAAGTKAPYPISIFGIYSPPGGGAEIEVPFPNGSGPTNPEVQMDDPVRGRIRLQLNKNEDPPFTGTFVSNAANPPGVTTANFYREYIVKLNGNRQTQLPPQTNGLPGLFPGQYRLPIFEYIFGEGTNFGEPVPPFNFNDFGFLNVGEGPAGRLNPFPIFQ